MLHKREPKSPQRKRLDIPLQTFFKAFEKKTTVLPRRRAREAYRTWQKKGRTADHLPKEVRDFLKGGRRGRNPAENTKSTGAPALF